MAHDPYHPIYPDASTRSSHVSLSRRLLVFARDDYECVVCGSNRDLTVDHVRPKSKGGGGGTLNLQTLCSACNRAKGGQWDGRAGVGQTSPPTSA